VNIKADFLVELVQMAKGGKETSSIS